MSFKLLILIALMFNKNHSSMNCYKILAQKQLIEIIENQGISIALDGEQFPSERLAIQYKLTNGKYILISGSIIEESFGLLINDYECLQELLNSEKLPVENPNMTLWEYDQENIKKLDKNIPHYINILNIRTIHDFETLEISGVEKYYNKILTMRNDKTMQQTDLLALFIAMGELFRQKHNGRWLLRKQVGEFNSFFEPYILLPDNQVFDISAAFASRINHGLKFDEKILNRIFPYWSGVPLRVYDEVGVQYKILN